jgi:hypothetical protein
MYLNSGTKNFHAKRVLLFLETQDNPLYYKYVYSIAKKIHDDAGFLHIALINEQFSAKKISSAVRFLKRSKCQAVFSNDLMTTFGFEVSIINIDHASSQIRRTVDEVLNEVTYCHELRNIFPGYKYLGLSVHSLFCSNISLSSDPLIRIHNFRKELRTACERFFQYFQFGNDFMQENIYDLVIFANGRTPEQAVFKELAESRGVPWMALEHGAKPGESYHLESFQTQDRLGTQDLISVIKSQLTGAEIAKIEIFYEEWSRNQRFNVHQNPTLAFREHEKTSRLVEDRCLPIFTSSIDEEVSCPNWSEDNIRSLLSATVALCHSAYELGWEPIVVIHPNTLNKKWHDLSFMLSVLINEKLKFALPWDSVSSYEYLNQSEFVFTWRSTIGLEAIISRKRVSALSDTTYDVVVSLPEAHKLLAQNNLVDFVNFEREAFTSKLVIYYYTNYGTSVIENLSEDDLLAVLNYESLLPLGSFFLSLRNRYKRYINPLKVFQATPKEFLSLLYKCVPRRYVNLIMLFFVKKYSNRIPELVQSVDDLERNPSNLGNF